MYVCMYVCIYVCMGQPDMVANLARGQLNRKRIKVFPVVSVLTQELLRDSSRFLRRRPSNIIPLTAIGSVQSLSGYALAYR